MNKEGRFGHQLSQLATLIAYQLLYNQNSYYDKFKETYSIYYTANNLSSVLNEKINFRIKVLYYLFKYFGIENIVLGKYYFKLLNKKNQLIFRRDIGPIFLTNKHLITDYFFNDVKILIQYRKEIQKICSIKFNITNRIHQHIKKIKNNKKIIIVVAIRKTDFRIFENGRYFYEDKFYADAVNQLIQLINNENYHVFICSDDTVDIALFNTEANFEKRHYLDDFYILQEADYIISTKSIFSTMACYLGNAKLYQLYKKGLNFTMEDFITIEEQLTKFDDFSNEH